METRALILKSAGYSTLKTTDLKHAIDLAHQCDMSIIGHTFEPREQRDFVERIHEVNPDALVVCLEFGLVAPEQLLKTVAARFQAEPESRKIWTVEPSHVVVWPQPKSIDTL